MVTVCVLSDMHLNKRDDDDDDKETISLLKEVFEPCDINVYNGDILDFDDNHVNCAEWGELCETQMQRLTSIIHEINKPFVFSLGNHDRADSPHEPFRSNYWGSMEVHRRIAEHPLHAATKCSAGATACVLDLGSEGPKISMLYSGTYYCPHSIGWSYYGCPTLGDVDYLNEHAQGSDILFTHIPPPQVAPLPFSGIRADWGCTNGVASMPGYICSWAPTKTVVLPSIGARWHVSGHDHNNLFVTEPDASGTRFMQALKTGRNGYGPCFLQDVGGITVFEWTQADGLTLDRFRLLNGTTLPAAALGALNSTFDASMCPVEEKETEESHALDWWVWVLIVAAVLALFVCCVCRRKCYANQKSRTPRTNRFRQGADALEVKSFL